MTVAVRVIPCLDVDGGRVVKGVNFRALRDAGDPVEMAAYSTPQAPTSSPSSTSRRPAAAATPCTTWCGAPPSRCSSR